MPENGRALVKWCEEVMVMRFRQINELLESVKTEMEHVSRRSPSLRRLVEEQEVVSSELLNLMRAVINAADREMQSTKMQARFKRVEDHKSELQQFQTKVGEYQQTLNDIRTGIEQATDSEQVRQLRAQYNDVAAELAKARNQINQIISQLGVSVEPASPEDESPAKTKEEARQRLQRALLTA